MSGPWTIVLRGGPLAGPDGSLELELKLEELPAALPLLAGGSYVRSADHGLRYDWTPAAEGPAEYVRALDDDRLRELAAGTGFSVDGLIDSIHKSRLEPPGIAPHNRLRYITARGTAEIIEACDADDRLHPHDRELIHASAHQLMQMIQIVHEGREADA